MNSHATDLSVYAKSSSSFSADPGSAGKMAIKTESVWCIVCRLCSVPVTVKLFNSSDVVVDVHIDTRVSHDR